MINALWLCLIPIIWAAVSHFALKKTLTWKEALLQGGAAMLIVFLMYAIFSWNNTHDVEILNGAVTGKEQNRVSCSHSYSCNCRESCSGSGNSRSCHQVCDTCYEHTNDWDWDVYTTVGTKTIDRVDRRGSDEPPRWTAVKIGEPAAAEHGYTNYIKAAPNSLFNTKLAENEAKTKATLIPAYPRVYDYYRVDHTISVGANVPNRADWDNEIDQVLKSLGASNQVNILMVFVGGQGREYKDMLERAWLGGKKNDVIVVVGVTGTKIDWVEAFTFGKTSGNAILAVRIRDGLQGYGTTEDAKAGVAQITKLITADFHRKKMSDYEYLKDEGGPTATQIGWLVFVLVVLLIASTIWLHKVDVFGEEFYSRHPSLYNFRRRIGY